MPRNNSDFLLFGEQSARLAFRKVLDSDFNDWLRFCAYPESLKYIMPQSTKTPEENCVAWFKRIEYRYNNDLGGMNALIEKESGSLVGQCGLLKKTIDNEPVLEIGYSMMPEFRGKGYAQEAAQKCRDFAFENQLADQLFSVILPGNDASVRVATKNGMKFLKRTVEEGDIVDVYSISKVEWLNLK
jgi:RimJ/RimL family protein N-acetyltransferase